MGKHLCVGENVQGGSVIFNDVKTKNVIFNKPFIKVPSVKLEQNSLTNAPPCRYNVTMTGFTVTFATKVTLTLAWEATEL